MAIKDAIACMTKKLILGEYGPCTRPFVILDIDEYNLILKTLETADKRRRVPVESHRESPAI